jgi:hypothetical protein
MGIFSAIAVAWNALRIDKGRSGLTSLGIIIGIGAVIALVSAGDGARRKPDERLESVGKNLILIRAGARTQLEIVADYVPLTAGDVEAAAWASSTTASPSRHATTASTRNTSSPATCFPSPTASPPIPSDPTEAPERPPTASSTGRIRNGGRG